ncbi:glycosyltransferase family 1 [Opitutaceae bacterium TAV5]|nr:glycosyltransferase family 1 [Opitutaceae bacterium TAV5]
MKTTMKHITLALGISLAALSPLARAASSELVRYADNGTKTAKDDTYSVSSTIGFAPEVVSNVFAWASNGGTLIARGLTKASNGTNNLAIGNGNAITDEAAAVALGKYFTFEIEPTAGNQLTLTEVAAKTQSDVGAGLQALTVTAFLRSSVDNYASTLASFTITTPENQGTGTSSQFGLLTTGPLGVAFSGLTEKVTFRLYAYVQSDNLDWNHIVRFDDIRISGYTTSAIPEPGTTALLAGAAMLLAVWGMRCIHGRKQN